MTQSDILLTGIKPTGILHVGNYAGAIKPMLELLKNHTGEAFCFIADIHALNQVHEGKSVRQDSYQIAATLLALGLDPEQVTFFRQSAVPQHAELSTLLTNVTGKGLMERGHAFKAIKADNEENGKDPDADVNMGLFNYPILMAADILLYQSTIVPVGRDQRQHVEFTRDIAGSFNSRYSDTFTLPNYDAQNPGPEVTGLDGRKMSKSYNNTIPVFASEPELKKLVKRIVTDSKQPEEPKDPEASTIIHLYRQFADEQAINELENRFRDGGIGYGEAKDILFHAINNKLAEPREVFHSLVSDRKKLDEILAKGAENARDKAEKTMRKVRRKMGLHEF